MTKICPNCKIENQDTSEFCQNCGNKLGEIVKITQPEKSPKTGFMGWWNKQSKGIKGLSIFSVCCLGLILIVGIGGMSSPDKTTTNVTTASAPVVDSSTFENQFVSFTKPTDLTIQDKSNGTNLDVMFYQGDTLMGEINSATTTSANIKAMLSDGINTTIAGKKSNQYSDSSAIGAYVFIEDNTNGDKMIINLDFDPSFSADYNLIKNSLAIKQNPSQ